MAKFGKKRQRKCEQGRMMEKRGELGRLVGRGERETRRFFGEKKKIKKRLDKREGRWYNIRAC